MLTINKAILPLVFAALSSSPNTVHATTGSVSLLSSSVSLLSSPTNVDLVYNGQCLDFSIPAVQSAALNTGDGCATNTCPGGCCRFYTAFLTCDEDNTYPHQPCVCNENTDSDYSAPPTPSSMPRSTPPSFPPAPTPPSTSAPTTSGESSGGKKSKKGGDDSEVDDTIDDRAPGSTDAPASSSIPIASSAPVATPPPTTSTAEEEESCDNGSPWSYLAPELGLSTCVVNEDCAGIMIQENGNEYATCCKRLFCWCGAIKPDDDPDECVSD